MTDLEIAKINLAGHTICLCKEGKCITSDKHGITPMMSLIQEGRDLKGYSVADIIVGKAAAMLFIKAGIQFVFAKTLSINGKKVLEEHHINYECETLTEKIINRTGDDICPMEKTVLPTSDVEEAYQLLKKKIEEISAKQ